MSEPLPGVLVIHPDPAIGHYCINEVDFDPSIHQIYDPSLPEVPPVEPLDDEPTKPLGFIDWLNAASAEMLDQRLAGIGPASAQLVVNARAIKSFAAIADLPVIRGVNWETLERDFTEQPN